MQARAVVLAMGARERTRAAIRIPGTRPAGVFTAGLAQRLVNLYGLLPGKRAVILGSGDIGLIMARRLTLEGVEVVGVFELMPYANGLNRNIVQCLHDFDIPLHLSTTVVQIHGHDRVEKVTVAPVDDGCSRSQPGWDVRLRYAADLHRPYRRRTSCRVSCGCAWIRHGRPGGHEQQWRPPSNGVFACGNVVHIHDLVDFVSGGGQISGPLCRAYVCGQQPAPDNVLLQPGENVAYCVPHTLSTEREHMVYLACGTRGDVHPTPWRQAAPSFEKKLRYVFPAEMVTLTVRPRFLERFHGDALKVDVL